MTQEQDMNGLLQNLLNSNEDDSNHYNVLNNRSQRPTYLNQTQFNFQDLNEPNPPTPNSGSQMPTFMNRSDMPNYHQYNMQTLLCLTNAAYMSNNPTLSAQVKILTADVLRTTGNKPFVELERERNHLEMENCELHGKIDQLQKTLISVLNSQPSDNSNAPPSELSTTPELTINSRNRTKPLGCKVNWWNCPRADSDAFKRLPNNDGELVFAWMQAADGQLISRQQKKQCYTNFRQYWNSQDRTKLPKNFSHIGHEQLDNLVQHMESRNDWLMLCENSWKTIEVLKKNFASWRRRQDEGSTKDDNSSQSDKDVPAKRKARTKNKNPVARVVISDSDSGASKAELPIAKRAKVDKACTDNHLQKGKAKEVQITNGKIQSKNIATSTSTSPLRISIDMNKLTKKAAFIISQASGLSSTSSGSTPPTSPPAVTVADTIVPDGSPTEPNTTITSELPARQTAPAPIVFIEEFTRKVKSLPSSIPTAPKSHPLAVYADYVTQAHKKTEGIPTDDLWNHFDTLLTNLIPNGAVETRTHLVFRGKYGLPGLVGLVRHLAYERRMDCTVLEPKLERLIEAIDLVATAAVKDSKPKSKAKPKKTTPVPKKLGFEIPTDLVCPKWLYAADWQQLPGNEGKSEEVFLEHWTSFEKENKADYQRYHQLSRERNVENAKIRPREKAAKLLEA
ncbi:hypothetical protein E1B28_006875 [Marasmius oreades]|uniref:Uncharacterized protein n=1 Tax=Marasmius oreades TaxID=181124 RepID=A0A9P7S1U5_9AGAR|nr:uncharacterized protein E1B28_006875 [Marasmius oreades]KAG7093186.1 hypothetical protein E1B28_006875 [Marasmius oreades]